MTPSELIEAALTPLGTWERAAGLLRWLPLYKPYLPDNQGDKPAVEELIRCLFRNEKDEVSEPTPRYVFEALSIYVNHWKKDVSPTFLKDTLQEIFNNYSDLSLFHLLVQTEIPKKIFNTQYKKYFESPLEKIATSTLFQSTMRQDQYAGTCAWCQGIHWDSIMEPKSDHYGEVVILRIDGKATFSLKTRRDPSMVALRTLMTPTGEFACI